MLSSNGNSAATSTVAEIMLFLDNAFQDDELQNDDSFATFSKKIALIDVTSKMVKDMLNKFEDTTDLACMITTVSGITVKDNYDNIITLSKICTMLNVIKCSALILWAKQLGVQVPIDVVSDDNIKLASQCNDRFDRFDSDIMKTRIIDAYEFINSTVVR